MVLLAASPRAEISAPTRKGLDRNQFRRSCSLVLLPTPFGPAQCMTARHGGQQVSPSAVAEHFPPSPNPHHRAEALTIQRRRPFGGAETLADSRRRTFDAPRARQVGLSQTLWI